MLLLLISCTKKSEDDKLTTSSKDSLTKTEDPFAENLFSKIAPGVPDEANIAPKVFRLSLNETFMEYTHLKHALVENDSTQAIMQTNQMKKAISKIDLKLLDDNMKKEWDKMNIKIEQCCKGITTTENIDKQRKKFSEITGIMTELVKKFGLGNKTVYVLTCPDNKLGNWLVDTKDISNPYLGKQKPGEKPCVEIVEALKFD